MINEAVKDALGLCLSIYNSISPHDKWVSVNIARTNNRTFTFPDVREIPTSFGYLYDRAPQILSDEGVIIAMKSDQWVIGKENRLKKQVDSLTEVARETGLLTKDESFKYYWRMNGNTVSMGPRVAGQYSILVSVKAMMVFYNFQMNLAPKFTENKLHFLQQTVEFNGQLAIKSMSLLVANINSLVSAKELLEVDAKESYIEEVKARRITSVNDKLSKRILEIEKKIDSNDILRQKLIIARKDSNYGLFVNQKITSPEKTS